MELDLEDTEGTRSTENAESQEMQPELNEAAVSQFQEIGVSSETLSNLEGFTDLSPGQQLLALDDMKQILAKEARSQAESKQSSEFNDLPLGQKLLKGLKTLGTHKAIDTAVFEKEYLQELTSPEYEADNEEYLQQIAKVRAEGPEATLMEDGTIRIDFASGKNFTESSGETLESFNEAAAAFSKLPREWGFENTDLSVRQRLQYENAKTAYEHAREDLIRDKYIAEGETSAALAMNTLDEQIRMQQYFNTHPDAEDAFNNIQDQSLIRRAGAEILKTKGFQTFLQGAPRQSRRGKGYANQYSTSQIKNAHEYDN